MWPKALHAVVRCIVVHCVRKGKLSKDVETSPSAYA